MTISKRHYCILLMLACYCRPTDNAAEFVSDKMYALHSKIKCDRFAVQTGLTLTMRSEQLLNLTSRFIHLSFKFTKIKHTK